LARAAFHIKGYRLRAPATNPAGFGIRIDADARGSGDYAMTKLVYQVVEHDGGWAYRADGVYSETYPDHAAALAAAQRAAREQRVADEDIYIQYEDENGRWLSERADGHDRPSTRVEDLG
jgi:hypothetical protein